MGHADDSKGWGMLAESVHRDKVVRPDDPPYRENAFLAFWDRSQDVFGTVHATTSANGTGRRARCNLVVDRRSYGVIEPLDPMELTSPSVSFGLDGHIAASGADFEIDLVASPRNSPADYSASQALPGIPDAEPLKHFQQSATVAGTVTVRDTKIAIDGLGIRDRTWGFRDENASWLEYYACFLCFDDFDLTAMKFSARQGAAGHGFIINGEHKHVTSTAVKRNEFGSITDITVAAEAPDSFTIHVQEQQARIWTPLGEPDGPGAISVYDEFCALRTDTGQHGFGMIEQGILRQLA